ncbi:MAG: type II toxin-antitoxin system RelE/ParE family toxin [Actinomycetota bacterium]|nr:type II toxin-antitoxin system RelE/ParE family toxin [Actinomycetota bacterium]
MTTGGWPYRYLAEAVEEREALVPKERAALINAEIKLAVFGPNLPFPHSSVVQGADRLRELRPRGGRSPWRALYRRVGGEFVIAAVGPEAQVDPRGFAAACRRAEARLAEMESEQR